MTDHESERLVRNVYKVLLTRGMIGTIIYSADPKTRKCSGRWSLDASSQAFKSPFFVKNLECVQRKERDASPSRIRWSVTA